MKWFFFLLFWNISFAETRLDSATIEQYLKIQKEFYDQVCTPGTEVQYQKLLKEYIGDGNYIPTLLDEKIDLKTIKSSISLIDLKLKWINQQNIYVQNLTDFNRQLELLNKIKKLNIELQDLKKSYFVLKKNSPETLNRAKDIFNSIVINFEELKSSSPFLLSFKFPVDHLSLRAEYEKVKDSNDKNLRARANLIFFFRKVVQDGSVDEETTKSDSSIRASFDSLYLSLNKTRKNDLEFFLTDAERVDLNFNLRNFEIILKNGVKKMAKRLEEWEFRTQRTKMFYQNLIENKKIKISENSQLQDVTQLLESRSRALYNLKDFSLTNMSKTYEFWAKKSELFQSLFVLETILYSEVGRSDENVGFFRQDVAQVVYNRLNDSRFNFLASNDPLSKYLSKNINSNEHPWLNVLFKEGEFSFTYFYIPGNLQIYCPDETRIGRFLRKENLKIAMKILNKPRGDFKGIRYYSRVSMFGRIPMDSIWQGFMPVPEDPGTLLKRQAKKLKQKYELGEYRFHYNFTGTDLKRYEVIEIKGQNYVIDPENSEKIYTYRNPHLFKFFSYIK
jgi:hypothetical protein